MFAGIVEQRGLGQRDIARISGVNESQISRLARGMQGVTVTTAAAMISAFDRDDKRALVVAYMHDVIRAFGGAPEEFPIGNVRTPALTDLTTPILAKKIAALLNRSHWNPGIGKMIDALESLTREVPKSDSLSRQVSRKFSPPVGVSPRKGCGS